MTVLLHAGLPHDHENSSLDTGLLATAVSSHFSNDQGSVHPSDSVGGGVVSHLTSRFGKVKKPVCRFIESMVVREELYNKDDVLLLM